MYTDLAEHITRQGMTVCVLTIPKKINQILENLTYTLDHSPTPPNPFPPQSMYISYTSDERNVSAAMYTYDINAASEQMYIYCFNIMQCTHDKGKKKTV